MLTSSEIELYYFCRNLTNWLIFIPKEKQLEFEEYDELTRQFDKEQELYYKRFITPDVKRNEFEFIREIQNETPEIIIDIKKNQIEKLTQKLAEITRHQEEMEWKGVEPWWIKIIRELHNPKVIISKIKKLQTDIYFLENKQKLLEGQIDEMDIVRAKEYPMESLVEVNQQGFGYCPFHQEKTASFYIKQNFGYCFGCGKSVDTIQFIMDTKGINFVEAVKLLTNKK